MVSLTGSTTNRANRSIVKRIVALSDLHGFLPDITPCDLLVVAGDVCPDRLGPFLARHNPKQQQAWFDRNVRPWLARAPATHKILTWGNHDWCGQACSFEADSPLHADTTDLQIVVCGHAHAGFGRYEHNGIPIYNVSVVDEQYRMVNAPTIIDLQEGDHRTGQYVRLPAAPRR
jgi:hypothetical protein